MPHHDPYSTSEIEDLGCWSTRKEKATEPNQAVNVVHHLGLDVAYTRVPQVTRWRPEDDHVVFSQLAAAIYPVRPFVSPQSLPRFASSPLGHSLSPDVQLTCFDFLYYATSGVDAYEWRFSWSPAWQSIAQHLKFTQPMLDLGQEYLRKAFLVDESHSELPPVSGCKVCPINQLLELIVLLINKFVAVHVRRGDSAYFCSTDRNPDCFPPLSVYKKHVDDMVSEIKSRHDIDPHALQVLVMSGKYICRNLFLSLTYQLLLSPNRLDEVSHDFWEEVRNEGWFHINHTTERTLERLCEWYPLLIDVVTQSYAVGFVGTEDSTSSLMGLRRVESWNGGVTSDVDLRKGI